MLRGIRRGTRSIHHQRDLALPVLLVVAAFLDCLFWTLHLCLRNNVLAKWWAVYQGLPVHFAESGRAEPTARPSSASSTLSAATSDLLSDNLAASHPAGSWAASSAQR